jgi:sugar lactone lactonase YvrE
MIRHVSAGLLLASAVSLVALRSDAGSVSLIASFNPAQSQLPESITIDEEGTVFLSMSVAATVYKIIPDGHHSAVPFAPLPVAAGGVAVGLKLGPDDHLYAVSAAFDPALDASHVWRISPSGAVSEYAHLDPNGFPNDLAFDDDGDLFVTDSKLGLVYKIDPARQVSVWLSDPRLVGDVTTANPTGVPYGADGIAFDKYGRHLYVDNFDFGEVFRVAIDDQDAPGPLELVASDPRIVGADGMAFDEEGDLYLAVNKQNQIAVLHPDGAISVVASGAPLDNPSSLVFGPAGCASNTLFISSFAIGEALTGGTPRPSLDATFVPFPGLPLSP